jgi:predicted dehydrogenase
MAAGYKADFSFELSGERGAIKFTWRRPNELQFYSHCDPQLERGFRTIYLGPGHPGADRFWPVAGQGLGYGDGFTILLSRFLEALREGRELSPNFEDGLRAAEVVDAALTSSDTRQWTQVVRGQSDMAS